MKRIPLLAAASLALVSISFTACESPGQGAAYGAGAGAIIGGIAGGDVRSAAIGAGAGAAAGALIGHANREDRRRQEAYYADREYAYRGRSSVPVGRKSSRRGYVYSPYKPHALVNVRGVPHGARVIDPATDRVFINP